MTDALPKAKGPYPPVYFGIALLMEWGLHTWLPVAQLLSWPWRWIGILVILKGVGLTLWARLQLLKHKTTVIPFHKSDHLVTTGPFNHTRNPMYLGVVLVLCGAAFLFGSLTPWVGPPLFWLVVARLIVPKEEAGMRMQFGAAYDEYCARVKRWF